MDKETIRKEKLEILRHELYRMERLNENSPYGIWDHEVDRYRRAISRTEAGVFHVPQTYSERQAHTYALKLAREGYTL